ncbi:MAG: hypothetical protein GF416_03420 [Candidatus Altiarchaeales archaeon]|nr:hypothetical protein [Candidatus Altiarchaeales archaeon]MBD3416169.1 hypothetical protein [Candidatus Altiarchaeales archaeon]
MRHAILMALMLVLGCIGGEECEETGCPVDLPDKPSPILECRSLCRDSGYDNVTVVGDAGCTHLKGEIRDCTLECSYRKILESSEEGMICCCRTVKYVEGVGCDGTDNSSYSRICGENKPGG